MSTEHFSPGTESDLSFSFVLFPTDSPCLEQLITEVHAEQVQLQRDCEEHGPQNNDREPLKRESHFLRIQIAEKVIIQVVECITNWSESEDEAAYQVLLHEKDSVLAEREQPEDGGHEADEPHELPRHGARQTQLLQRARRPDTEHDEKADGKTQKHHHGEGQVQEHGELEARLVRGTAEERREREFGLSEIDSTSKQNFAHKLSLIDESSFQ